MAYKQKNSINNMLNVPFHQKKALMMKGKKEETKQTMRTIPGSDNPKNFIKGGTVGIGPGGFGKTILRGLAGAKPYTVGGKYYGDILKSGKLTNSNKGLLSGIKNRIINFFN